MKKILFFIFLTSVLSYFFINEVNADVGGGTKRNGITTAWYSPSVISYGYEPHFDAGRQYWNGVSSKAHIYKNTGE